MAAAAVGAGSAAGSAAGAPATVTGAAPAANGQAEGAQQTFDGMPLAELRRAERLFLIFLGATGEFFALRRAAWRHVCAALHPDRGWDTAVWQHIAQLHQRFERAEAVPLQHARDTHDDDADAQAKLQRFREEARVDWKSGTLAADAFGALVERAEAANVRGYADVVLEILALSTASAGAP
jgi:hypothetical protein